MANEFVKDNIDYATDEPLWKIPVLFIITLGFYGVFWFYMNMRFIKFIKNQDDFSPWFAILWKIPLIPYYTFLNLLHIFYPNSKKQNHLKTILLVIILYVILYANKLHTPYCLISSFAFIPLIIMQIEVNKYIHKTLHERKET